MKLQLVAVGRGQPAWVRDGTETYLRRLPGRWDARVVEVAAESRANVKGRTAVGREAERLLNAVRPGDRVVALDERGATWSTREFAQRFDAWQHESSGVSFLVGGADGLDQRCLDAAETVLSLSRLTLPHGLVRVVWAEQVYRAHTVLTGHPYHRD